MTDEQYRVVLRRLGNLEHEVKQFEKKLNNRKTMRVAELRQLRHVNIELLAQNMSLKQQIVELLKFQ